MVTSSNLKGTGYFRAYLTDVSTGEVEVEYTEGSGSDQ